VQKRARPRFDVDFVAGATQLQRVEGFERRFGLAQRIAKGREIVVTDQMPGTLAHRCDIERWCHLPHPAAVERRRGPAVQDAVKIDAAGRGKPRVEIFGCRCGG
jgi:hypothetical protein